MPILQFNGVERREEIDHYADFVTKMIECKNSMVPGNLNLGISIPSFYRYKQLDKLLSLYDVENTEPTFVSIDFSRTGFDDTKRIGIVNTINTHFKENKVEDYFLYGFNVRTYRRGQPSPVSDEMLIARRGFNAVGAPHYEKSNRMIPPTTQLSQLGVVFESDDYHFHHLTDKKQFDSFSDWASDNNYSIDLKGDLPKEAPKIRTVMKKYNLCKENSEFFDLSDAIRKNDTDVIKDRLNRGI